MKRFKNKLQSLQGRNSFQKRGPTMHLRTVEMQFNAQKTFAARSPDAYETLFWDVTGVISAVSSRVAVRVIHTDEERMIAKTV